MSPTTGLLDFTCLPNMPCEVSSQWAHRVLEEFFAQGDEEESQCNQFPPPFDTAWNLRMKLLAGGSKPDMQ